ncbi:hypothetical protein EVAR_19730_1 [Eumeta japonica]|uniref:Uncharacterized protein n=1 Tax=Eumeta variegata TaxID=151549 RepID=A0A4C1UQU1_EUMVA|nr:hypothetical protein EVAR_19730_1 [Eumeta japonica]
MGRRAHWRPRTGNEIEDGTGVIPKGQIKIRMQSFDSTHRTEVTQYVRTQTNRETCLIKTNLLRTGLIRISGTLGAMSQRARETRIDSLLINSYQGSVGV